MSDRPGWRDAEREREVARQVIQRRTDPRIELTVFVTPDVEEQVRQRLHAIAEELIELTGDMVVIDRYELAKVVYLNGCEPDEQP